MTAKNIALGTLLGISLASSGAALAASADNFEGFNLSLGVKAQSSTFKTRENGAGSWDDNVSGGSGYAGSFSYDRTIQWPNSAAKIGAEVGLGYNFKVSDNFLLGLSLSGDFIKLMSGKTKNNTNSNVTCGNSGSGNTSAECYSNYIGGSGGGSGSGYTDTANLTLRTSPDFESSQVTLKDHYGVAFRPMFAVTDQTAVYLKASYNQAKTSGFGPAVTVYGPGVGVGFETNLSESWFLRAELEQIRYTGSHGDQAASIDVNGYSVDSVNYTSGKMSANAKVTSGTIAIGLRF